MAIAFKDVATSQRTTGGTSMTGTLPTFAAGDLLVAAFVTGDANSGLSGFAGWTHAFAEKVDGTVGIFDVYYKIADGSETNLSLSWTTNAKPQVIIASYSGVDSTTPVVAADGALNATNNASVPTPTVNNTGSGVEWAVAFFTFRVTSSGNKSNTYTPPGGMTERADVNMSAAGSSPWVSMELADSNGAVTAGNHSYTATVASGGNSSHKFGALLYLNPAAGGSPQTQDAGKVTSGAAVRGANLTPGTATLSAGKVASGAATRGADVTGTGTATLSAGNVTSSELVHGADLTPGTVTLDVGKVASTSTGTLAAQGTPTNNGDSSYAFDTGDRLDGPPPSSLAQGFYAARIRMANDPVDGHVYTVIETADEATSEGLWVGLYQAGATIVVELEDFSAANFAFVNISHAWTAGEEMTVVASWDATTLKLSLNGGAFVTAARAEVRSPDGTALHIGNENGTTAFNYFLDGDVLWAARGEGSTLVDADAAELDAFGNNDPGLGQLPAGTTFLWTADDTNYLTPAGPHGADVTAGASSQTLDAGKVTSDELVHGANLTPGTATVDAGKVTSSELVHGADLTPGTATLSAGKVASDELVRGADLDAGTATLSAGKVTSSELVRGADLTTGPAPQELDAGKVTSGAAVRGADLDPGTATLAAGKVTSSASVNGADLAPGTATLSVGRVTSSAAVRGSNLTPGTATLAVGRASSTATVRGVTLSFFLGVLGTVELADTETSSVALADTLRAGVALDERAASVALTAAANEVALTDTATGSVALSERPL